MDSISASKYGTFFDIWHVAKAISKKMLKASQDQGCEPIKEWMKAVRNHLY